MSFPAMRAVGVCLLLLTCAFAGSAQERGLPDITIPVAPAGPTITATVSLITGPAPEMTADAVQLGGDSGLAIMQGVPLEEARAWSPPVSEGANVPLLKSIPVIGQLFEGQPPAAATEDLPAVEEPVPTPDHPDVKALASGLTEYPGMGGTILRSAMVSDLLRGAGVAVKSERRELKLGEEQAVNLNWPDDRPRYYLEQQDQDLYRRVELADREGYSVTLRATRMGANLAVDMDLTRNTLAGGRYDKTINAYVGKPTLIKTICQTSAPVRTGTATVVTWNTPSARAVDRAAAAQARALYEQGLATLDDVRIASGLGKDPELAKIRYREGLATLGDVMAATAAAAPSGAMPGLAIVLSAGPLPGTNPLRPPAAEPPDAPAAEPVAPARGEPGGADEVGAQVQVDFRFVEVPVGSAEWPKLAEWRGVTSTDEVEEVLSILAHQKAGRLIASPSLVALDGHRAEINIGYSENYNLGSVAVYPNEGLDLNAGEGVLEVPLGLFVAVTPRLEANERVSLALETRFEELLDKFGEDEGEVVPIVGTREANVRLQVPRGKTAIIRGLVRMDREPGEDGKAVRRPVETVILVTPRLLTEGVQD